MSEEHHEGAPLPKKQPTVVGIGASAGGLTALKEFFHHVPPDSGLTFVVVVHLSPDHKSHLADLLQAHVRIPVQQVTQSTPLQPNQVYIIPPNANLDAIDTHVRLSKLEEDRRERAPIDHFFRTLADTYDGNSIGVILTGTGSDGALGVKAIKAKGGLVLVQDPSEAEYDGMPLSAIETGLVDKVLNLNEMVETILRFDRTEPRVVTPPDGHEAELSERQHLQRILALLRARTDRDFSRYKPSTILRRISRRMQLNFIEDLPHYIEKLREQPDETRALADDFLITVTNFFRDPEVFEKLGRDVIPRLFKARPEGGTVRVWSVGCATGEEAYSLAMLMLEEAGRMGAGSDGEPPNFQIFASDLHRHSLEKARKGFYAGDIQADVTPERLARFFTEENGGYRIKKEVRDLVVFAPHNLMGDPPFSRLNLITCRNLLIYLQNTAQREVIELFHYALLPDGELVLGTAENTEASDLFRVEDKKLCFYRRRNVPGPDPRLPVFPMTRFRSGSSPDGGDGIADSSGYALIHQRLMERFAPPSILLGPDNRLVHLSENAGRYLVHPGGEVTASIFKLVRDEFRLELRAALQTVRGKRVAYDSKPLPVRFNGHSRAVVIHVRPPLDADQEGFALVIFEERGPWGPETTAGQPLPAAASESNNGNAHERNDENNDEDNENARVDYLESELNEAHQRLQAIIEEYETTQEEMKASNEEMQSANEELRSTMEELETSKEELQSINEELQTVNQENRHKVEELAQLTSDLQNLLTATEIATLFLDRQLRILRFTPKLSELFNIRAADRGRPIFDLTHRLGYPELRADAEAVLARLTTSEREVEDERGLWFLARMLPYRSTDDRIEGVVITFTNVTKAKLADAALQENQELLLSALEAGRMATFDWNPQSQSMTFSPSAADILGIDPHIAFPSIEALLDLIHPDDRESRKAALERSVDRGEDFETEYRVIRPRDREVIWVAERARVRRDRKTGAIRLKGLIWDITERRHAEARWQTLVRELNHRVKNTLATVQSIAAQTLRHTSDPAEFVTRFQGRLQALARAHDIVAGANWEGSELREVITEQLALGGSSERISLRGPEVRLSSRTSLALALVIHELGTNARKYGSLSVPDGRLDVTWTADRERNETKLRIDWVERGGPPVTALEKKGFGTEMIRRSMKGGGGEADLRFESAGVTCHIMLPLQMDGGGELLRTGKGLEDGAPARPGD